MKRSGTSSDSYQLTLSKARTSLLEGDYENAQLYISQAMSANMDAAAPHNLLGILMELMGNEGAAQRHYRAAYSLEPNYKPACRNLQRMVLFQWGPQSREYDFGEEKENEPPARDIIKSVLE